LDNDKEEDQQIEPCTITSKKVTFALEKIRKYIETNKSMEDLLKPLDYLDNRIENNVLNKNKQ